MCAFAWVYASAIGQDSHRFVNDQELADEPDRRLILGGVSLTGERPLAGNSDADVLLHALTNAISGITGRNILGKRADELCLVQGIRDSAVYLREALSDLVALGWHLSHLSFSIEGKRPKLAPWIDAIRQHLADLTGLALTDVGLTATSGEGLTAFGRGEGLQVFCLITVRRHVQSPV
jgi:2-C-methyl-D-erythritol 2,4-cyclodiphosphate synthase